MNPFYCIGISFLIVMVMNLIFTGGITIASIIGAVIGCTLGVLFGVIVNEIFDRITRR